MSFCFHEKMSGVMSEIVLMHRKTVLPGNTVSVRFSEEQ